MLRIVKYAIVVNVAIALLFAYANFYIWNQVNGEGNFSRWTPLTISVTNPAINGINIITNSPFWLFWILLIINLYVIYKVAKTAK